MRRVVPVLVIVAIMAAVVVGYFVYFAPSKSVTGLSASGTVETQQTIISPLTSGRITAVLVNEGQQVKTGAVLFRIDSRVLKDQLAQAEAAERAARVNYREVRDDSGSTSADIAAAKAQFDQAKLAVASARILVSYATVTSPTDAIASSVAVHAGEVASPGQTLAILSDPKKLQVSVFVPETEIGNVHTGDKATLRTDSSSKTFDGTVTFIASQAEFTPANIETKDQRVKLVFEVRLSVSDPSGTLKPGMPVDVRF